MNVKIDRAMKVIFPNSKINFLVILLFTLGLISGAIYLTLLSESDKQLVVEQLKGFVESVNAGIIDSGQALKNSLVTNVIYLTVLFVMGISLIGIVVNVFLIYVKGFLVGFTLAGIIYIYKIKGILFGLIYVLSSQLILVVAVVGLGIYSIMFSWSVFKQVTSKKNNLVRLNFKKLLIVFVFGLILSLGASFLEVWCFPKILKLIIKLYI